MKESLVTFRKAVNKSADLQEKLKGGTDLVELGKENGHDFSAEDVTERPTKNFRIPTRDSLSSSWRRYRAVLTAVLNTK